MAAEKQDRDAIVSKATEIASEEKRAAYIAQACDDNGELKHQVEEQVAAHFHDDSPEKPAGKEDTGTPSGEQAGESPAKDREQLRELTRKHRRLVAAAATMLLLLLIAAVGGVGMAVWEWRQAKQARKAEQEAAEQREQSDKAAKKARGRVRHLEMAEEARTKERDRAQAAEREARRAEEDSRAILTFVKDRLLSAGRPSDVELTGVFWAETVGKNKDITLRKAVDGAAEKVGEAFADRPLAEAMTREMLGLSYLNLGEPKLAAPQYERALALREAMEGVNDADTAECRNKLAFAHRLAGRTADADRLVQQKPDSPEHAQALAVRGALLLSEQKLDEAELKLRQCLKIRQKSQPDDWTTFDTESLLGEALLGQKKYADAEPLLLAAYKGLKKHEDKGPSEVKGHLRKTVERLVRLYEARGQSDKAARWRKELEPPRSSNRS